MERIVDDSAKLLGASQSPASGGWRGRRVTLLIVVCSVGAVLVLAVVATLLGVFLGELQTGFPSPQSQVGRMGCVVAHLTKAYLR
jgi:hypothetical protein